MKIARTENQLIAISEFFSEDTKRAAFVEKCNEDYKVTFHDDNEVVGFDWRETLEDAENAAEDWVLGEQMV